MRHKMKRNTLGRAKDQQTALLRSLARGLFLNGGQIKTTLTKAKVLRSFVEKLITKGKKALKEEDPGKKLHYIRLIIKDMACDVHKSVLEAAAKHQERNGGYTRILKFAKTRRGDNTAVACLQILD